VNSAMTASGSRPSSARRSAARSQHIGLHRHCARCGQLGPARGRTVDGQDVMGPQSAASRLVACRSRRRRQQARPSCAVSFPRIGRGCTLRNGSSRRHPALRPESACGARPHISSLLPTSRPSCSAWRRPARRTPQSPRGATDDGAPSQERRARPVTAPRDRRIRVTAGLVR